MNKRTFCTALLCLGLGIGARQAMAGGITVNATDVIYAAANNYTAANAGGTTPGFISLAAGSASIQFSASGLISLNGLGNFNDPDGVGAAPSSSWESGFGSISGVTLPNAGGLVGVFVNSTSSLTGTAPTALNFVASGTSFTSLSPSLNQVFFIGDGLTGDGSGAPQTFNIPAGSVAVYLGISDACGYNGGPSCYGDNSGTYNVTYTVTAGTSPTPEPASVGLIGLGLAACVAAGRRLLRR